MSRQFMGSAQVFMQEQGRSKCQRAMLVVIPKHLDTLTPLDGFSRVLVYHTHAYITAMIKDEVKTLKGSVELEGQYEEVEKMSIQYSNM